jgi:TnpA family transposase
VPISFLNTAERARLNTFPAEIPPDDIITYFTLSPSDLGQIPRTSATHNRLGFALQLGALRYLGFFPERIGDASGALIDYVARQLEIKSEILKNYGRRAQTRSDHARQIQKHLGFRRTTPRDFHELEAWLESRALEHDRPILLFGLACERLLALKMVRPALTLIERTVAVARQRAWRETFRQVSPFLTVTCKAMLNQLLIVDDAIGHTPLAWFRQDVTRSRPRSILETLDKLRRLRAWRVNEIRLEGLTPNRRKFLAQLGNRSTSQAIERMSEDRRYPILLAFLEQAHSEIIDQAIDLFDLCIADSYAKAGRKLDEFRLGVALATNEKVRLLLELGTIVLDPAVTDTELRARIYRLVPVEKLRSAIDECVELIRPLDDSYFDLFAQRYGYLRQFAPAFLEDLIFRSNRVNDPLLNAIAILRTLNRESLRKVPMDAPLGFVMKKWRPYVVDRDGNIDRRYYELCILWELRAALRAGDVWLESSRRYADPESYLIPMDHWLVQRATVCEMIGVEIDGNERLIKKRRELEDFLVRVDARLPRHEHIRMENQELVVSRLPAEDRPQAVVELERQISARLPQVELSDLLLEVDGWTRFSKYFEHAGGSEPRTKDLLINCHASILAQACNLGLTRMANLADISCSRLAWCITWYLREETLGSANAAIVNCHHRHHLSRCWGGGVLSSSDGQRFPVAVQTTQARAIPRYFGFGRGLTFYTWTSDQFSQYGSKPTPSTVRDATYVLDAILDNETDLPIAEHTTDTAGYTDLVFALFDLLGLQFSPRLRDLGDSKLYRIDKQIRYHHLEPLLRGTINLDLIRAHWGDMLRIAGSLKTGWVTASLFLGKLQAYRRKSALTRALQEYGRLIKTIFILRYLDDESFRRRIGVQLNKGEAIHALRRFLFFANEGEIRRRQADEQVNQVSCLNLVTNAVILWNTVYMSAVLDKLRDEGVEIRDENITHLSPARYEHINPYGKFTFDICQASRTGLRPLREV